MAKAKAKPQVQPKAQLKAKPKPKPKAKRATKGKNKAKDKKYGILTKATWPGSAELNANWPEDIKTKMKKETDKNNPKSLLEIINECDNVPYPTHASPLPPTAPFSSPSHHLFFVPCIPQPVGLIPNSIVTRMPWTPFFQIYKTPTPRVCLVCDPSESTAKIGELLDIAREKALFRDLKGWCGEMSLILGTQALIKSSKNSTGSGNDNDAMEIDGAVKAGNKSDRSGTDIREDDAMGIDSPGGNHGSEGSINMAAGILIERSACSLFGLTTTGAHLNMYTFASGEMRLWISRRSHTKSTYAGLLDNTVAGGISAGETPFTTLLRECAEEANLDPAFVAAHAKACGTVSWWSEKDGYRSGSEIGVRQPGIQYMYDMEVGADIVPKPVDGQVAEFLLMSVPEVRERMARREFKPSCAVVLIDFFVRHGVVTVEEEKNYAEVQMRLHRKLPFPISL